MQLRKILIARFPFAPLGVSLPHEEEDRKKADLMQDFLITCPRARHLTSSQVVTAKMPTVRGLELEFWLYECDQMSLHLPFPQAGPATIGASDGFGNDVASVKSEWADSARRLNRAVSPTRTIDELRDESDFGVQLRELRARAKSNRPFYVSGNLFQPVLADVETATFQPQGIPARILARVNSLLPERAVLKEVQLLEPIPEDLSGAAFPSSLGMFRPKVDKDMEACVALMTAMDAGQYMTLDVVVCLDWVSAQPVHVLLSGIAAMAPRT